MQKLKKLRGILLGGMAAMCTIMMPGTAMAAGNVLSYQVPECYKEAEGMQITVNGREVPVIEYTAVYNHANFAFEGEAEVTITVPEEIKTFSISPLAHELQGTAEGNRLTFTLNESRYLLIKINGNKELALAADDFETDVPDSEGEGIYNLAENPYNGLDSSPEKPSDALQRAIDDANAAGGGTIYVPDGVYYTRNVVLKSNVNLYLEPSAVIRATGNWEDYEYHFHKNSLAKDGTWFITNEPGAENIRIYGRGYLDGNGNLMRKNGYLNNLFFTMQLSGLEIDGVTFKDSGCWMVMINRSDDVTIRNVKFYNENDKDHENDAIDICESQDVLVQHTIAISEDDTYSTKTWNKETDITENWVGEPEELNRVTFDDCLGWSRCCTFKVGDGCNQPQRNITFQNSFSYKSMAAMKLTPTYGNYVSENSFVENVVFDNIDIEGFWPRTGNNGISMWLQLEIKNANIPVYNTVVRNINVRNFGPAKSMLRGKGPNAMFEGVLLENITVPGLEHPARTLAEMNVLNTTPYYKDLIILPEDIPVSDKKIVLQDDFSTGLDKTTKNGNVKYDNFKGYNGGGIIRDAAGGDAFVVYEVQGADEIRLTVNSYNNKFPVQVYASDDEYGADMTWNPVTIQEQENGNYADEIPIMAWRWNRYNGSLAEGVRYVKISLPVPPVSNSKLWWLMLDDVALYADEEAKTSIEMRPGQKEFRMKTGQSITLYPMIANIKDPVVLYESSNPETVSVDDHGLLTALEQGSAVITAELEGTGLKTEACVTAYREAEELSLSETDIVMDRGETYQLEALVDPEDSEELITWISLDERIAAVDEHGAVKALKYGETVILCKTENHRRAECRVTVARQGMVTILHDPLSNSAFPEDMLAYEATENLGYDSFKGVTDGGIKRKDNAEDAWLIYKAENPQYIQYKLDYNFKTSKVQDELDVFISEDGEVWRPVTMEEIDSVENIHTDWNQVTRINEKPFEKGIWYIKLAIPQIQDLGAGGTRFWALIIDDVEIFAKSDKIEKITVEGPKKIKAGEEVDYSAVIKPEEAADQGIIWSVTDRSNQATQLAEIDSATGRLKARETGEIRVTAKAADGSGVTGSIDVDITENTILVDTIVIEGKTVLGFHETAEYSALIFPENADDQRVQWVLEDLSREGIAVISDDGVVETGNVAGTFVIKASASDAGRAAGRLKVRVEEDAEEKIPVEDIEIQGPDQVTVGETARYKAVATPANATKKDVVWTVENLQGKAVISANGTLSAQSPGDVKIIAAATDGSGVTQELVVEIVKKQSNGGSTGESSRSSRPVRRIYPASAGDHSGWRQDERGWWLAVGSSYARSEWKQVDGAWYFFGSDGYMVTGWLRLNRSDWYYMLPDGTRAVGWVQIDGEWYYFYPSGEMAADGKTPDGYFVDAAGRWIREEKEL